MTDIIIHDEAALTVEERSELTSLESIIERGKKTFIEVGSALMEIREKRLYREHYATFEEYTLNRWDFSSSRARQLIGAAQVAASLPATVTGVTPPMSEAHARPLAALAPEVRERVWREAVETAPDGHITRDHVQMVVDRALGKIGRFDNELFFGVDQTNDIVYLPGYATSSAAWDDARTTGLAIRKGEMLNSERSSDALTILTMPDIPDAPVSIAHGFWIDNAARKIYPMSVNEDDRPYRVRGLAYVYGNRTWRSVLNPHIREYQLCEPLIWEDPKWITRARFQPGMKAYCPKCVGYQTAWGQTEYRLWIPHLKEAAWICTQGHRTPDADIEIVESELEQRPPAESKLPEAAQDDEMKFREDSDTGRILDAIAEGIPLLGYLTTTPTLIEAALIHVPEYNKLFSWMSITESEVAALRQVLRALETTSLSARYAGVLAYFQFASGWYYAVDQHAKLVYWQQDATAETCEEFFPGCVAVKGSSLIEDREIYLKAGYRLVIEPVDRQPLKSK